MKLRRSTPIRKGWAAFAGYWLILLIAALFSHDRSLALMAGLWTLSSTAQATDWPRRMRKRNPKPAELPANPAS